MAILSIILVIFFLCKTVHLLANAANQDGPTGDYISCEQGWFLYGEQCYKIFGMQDSEKLSWDGASTACKNLNGNLATIDSEQLQEFLVAFLLLRARTASWIGLHDHINDSHFVWEDGTVFNYSNWKTGEPTRRWAGQDEDCVELIYHETYQGLQTGEWNDLLCIRYRAYICQTNKNKELKTSEDPRFCSADEGGGWKFENSCYHILKEKMNWNDAEKHCQEKFNGHLAMISDFAVDMFLKYILSTLNEDVWIGIKIEEGIQQKWASNWFVAYNNWKNGREEFTTGNCVVRSKEKVWRIVPCSEKYPFICEVSKDSAPVLKESVKGSVCPQTPSDWKDLGGDYCYFIDTTNKFNWYRANYECIRRGGSLASIHSKEEIDVLFPFVRYTQPRLYIGLHRLLEEEDTFLWSDRSQLDFVYWDKDEPNNLVEKCGEFWTSYMKWNDVRCEETKGYICSVRKIPPDVTVADVSSANVTGERDSQVSPNVNVVSVTSANVTGGKEFQVSSTVTAVSVTNANIAGGIECQCNLTVYALILSVCILSIIILVQVIIYYKFLKRYEGRQKKSASGNLSLQYKHLKGQDTENLVTVEDSIFKNACN